MLKTSIMAASVSTPSETAPRTPEAPFEGGGSTPSISPEGTQETLGSSAGSTTQGRPDAPAPAVRSGSDVFPTTARNPGDVEAKRYHEEAPPCDAEAFESVVRSRRSVRRFTGEAIPDSIVNRCLDLALLAPTSSNLQSWEFYRVCDPKKKDALRAACLGQLAAATAAELIVCVARPDTYRKRARQLLAVLESQTAPPAHSGQLDYYKKVVPLAYAVGPLSVLAPLKWLAFSAIGLFRPMVRGPLTKSDRKRWAATTTALATENLMLAFRAFGYDTCPMEGFDEVRVKHILDLPREAQVVMVIAAGKRAPGGIFGPQVRLPRDEFVFSV